MKLTSENVSIVKYRKCRAEVTFLVSTETEREYVKCRYASDTLSLPALLASEEWLLDISTALGTYFKSIGLLPVDDGSYKFTPFLTIDAFKLHRTLRAGGSVNESTFRSICMEVNSHVPVQSKGGITKYQIIYNNAGEYALRIFDDMAVGSIIYRHGYEPLYCRDIHNHDGIIGSMLGRAIAGYDDHRNYDLADTWVIPTEEFCWNDIFHQFIPTDAVHSIKKNEPSQALQDYDLLKKAEALTDYLPSSKITAKTILYFGSLYYTVTTDIIADSGSDTLLMRVVYSHNFLASDDAYTFPAIVCNNLAVTMAIPEKRDFINCRGMSEEAFGSLVNNIINTSI